MSRRLARGLVGCIAGMVLLGGCHRSSTPAGPAIGVLSTALDPAAAAASPQRTHNPVRFDDVSEGAGVRWKFDNGATGRHSFVETAGGGVAFLDYDRDGKLDLFAVQGGPLPGTPGVPPGRNALYHNDGNGRFTDVSAAAGVATTGGYGQGISAADFDNDGWEDLYVTAYGGNHLLRNRGAGRFEDVTAKARLSDDASIDGVTPWPLSSAWGDYDGDGRLDLFVCHYVRWSPALNNDCHRTDGKLAYCRPQVYEPSHCRLFHQGTGGTFQDVSQASGIAALASKAMGAAWLDVDGDGAPDLFVTNDTMPNFLLRNNRNGTFTDNAVIAGVAVGATGSAESGMGIGLADYDGDGREDLFDVNFAGEPKGVFRSNGHGMFENRSFATNMASTNMEYLGFGLECADYDNDGWPDLVVGNGHVLDDTAMLGPGATYAQSQQLFHNEADGRFTEDTRSLGDLIRPRVTRGLAVGDYDNDGAPDVLLGAQNGPLQLFRNDGGSANGWIGLQLVGRQCNRDAVGAKVTLRAGGRARTIWVHGGSSFCSQSDRRLLLGLGSANRVEDVQIRWPGGSTQRVGPLPIRCYYRVEQGKPPVAEQGAAVRTGTPHAR